MRPGPPARLLLVAWFLAPLAGMTLWAFADQWTAATVLPQDWGLRGWREALADGLPGALLRTVVLSSTVALLATPAGAMAARGLLRVGPRLRAAASVLLVVPVVLPPLTVVLGVDVLLLRLQIPAAVGVVAVLVVQALPYTTYVMWTTYQAYDEAYEDEARTLGASALRALLRVQLPLVAPGLGAASFLALLVGWSDYIVTLVVGGGRLVTLPVLVASNAAGTGNEPVVAALSVVAIVPPLVLLGAVGLLGRRGRRRAPTRSSVADTADTAQVAGVAS